MTTIGTTNITRINDITAILKAADITTDTIHNQNCRPLINAIHYLLIADDIRDYLQDVINNPWFFKLDTVVEEIFSGKYMLLTPELQWNTREVVDTTLHAT